MHAPVRTHTTPDATLGLRPRCARATFSNSPFFGTRPSVDWGLKAKNVQKSEKMCAESLVVSGKMTIFAAGNLKWFRLTTWKRDRKRTR